MTLLREYFSVKTKDQPRKFEHPVADNATFVSGKPLDFYDEQ
jgi:hypothetical protein